MVFLDRSIFADSTVEPFLVGCNPSRLNKYFFTQNRSKLSTNSILFAFVHPESQLFNVKCLEKELLPLPKVGSGPEITKLSLCCLTSSARF